MNRTQAQLSLLKFTLSTCAILFVFVGVSILDGRPSDAPSVVPAMVPEVVDAVKRVPAAIPRLLKEERNLTERPSFQVWQPPCLSAGGSLRKVTTGSRWIRMSTSACDHDREITGTKLENLSNGYLATVFLTGNSKLTSDFIPLNEGPNEFQMQLTLDSGENYSFHWTVDRTATASN